MQIENYDEQHKGGSIVAVFDLTIPALGFTCRRWKLIRNKKGGLFVTSPSFSVDDGSGEKTWQKYVEVSESRSREFQKAVLEALKPFLKEEVTF